MIVVEGLGESPLSKDPKELGRLVGLWAAATELNFPDDVDAVDQAVMLGAVQQQRHDRVIEMVQRAGAERLVKLLGERRSIDSEIATANRLHLPLPAAIEQANKEKIVIKPFGLVLPGRDNTVEMFDYIDQFVPFGVPTANRRKIIRSVALGYGPIFGFGPQFKEYGTDKETGKIVEANGQGTKELVVLDNPKEGGYVIDGKSSNLEIAFVRTIEALSEEANRDHPTGYANPSLLNANECMELLGDAQ
jgi:hypothetical protein